MEIKTFVFNPIQTNCYLLWDETGEAILIDCGCFFPHEKEILKKEITDRGLTPKYHLNTHMHFDHIFGNPFVEKEWKLDTWANDADRPWADSIAERVPRFGVRYDEVIPPLGRVLRDGDEIIFGKQRVTAIAVPGHSPGSLAYHLPEKKILFSGDALFHGSIGRTDFPDSDHNALLTSIRERLFTLPDDTVVYPGHDRPTTIGYEKKYNMYVHD